VSHVKRIDSNANQENTHPFGMFDSDFTKEEETLSDRVATVLDIYVKTPLSILWGDWRARTGLIILTLYVLMGTVGVMVVPRPEVNQGGRFVELFANWRFPLGTNQKGEDVFALIVHATPAMLVMILSGAVFSTAVATVVGVTSGYKGGRIDRVLTVISDIMLTIPGLPLVIVLAALFEPRHPAIVGLVLSVNVWAGLARGLRSQVLTLREESYAEASRVIGISTPTILLKDILPNLMPYILYNFVSAGRNIIFSSVGLYFLGVLPYTNMNWGVLLNSSYQSPALYSLTYVHILIAPMFAIIMLSFGLILLSQGFDRIFNPRLRAKHSDTIADEHEHA